MQHDHYGYPVNTESRDAADAYAEGLDLFLAAQDGAEDAFSRAIELDPEFSLAHVGLARLRKDPTGPAGVGALYVKDGFAWTDFGATSPEFRRRGSQGSVMAARLECALDLGCKKIFTCTGVNVPGDPQHSYSNILKAGFTKDYVRENFEPA